MATTYTQDDIYSELIGLANSLDDHVSKDEVVLQLRELANNIEKGDAS